MIGIPLAKGDIVVVSDTFSNDDANTGKVIAGRSPETSLSGGTYQESDQARYWGHGGT